MRIWIGRFLFWLMEPAQEERDTIRFEESMQRIYPGTLAELVEDFNRAQNANPGLDDSARVASLGV